MDTIRVRLGRLAGLLVAASLALGLLAAAPASAAPAPAVPAKLPAADRAAATAPSVTPRSPWCKPGWYKTGTFLTWKTSPWQSTVRGLNYSRTIRFRFTGGVYARYTYSNCHQSATHFFSSATYYQVKSCIRSWSCSISGWQSYKKRPPAAGYRWPSRYVGWDMYAWIFRVFRL
jgi:hypothetical protein